MYIDDNFSIIKDKQTITWADFRSRMSAWEIVCVIDDPSAPWPALGMYICNVS